MAARSAAMAQPHASQHQRTDEQQYRGREHPGKELAVVARLVDPDFLPLQRVELLHDPLERLGIGRAEVLAAAPVGDAPQHPLVGAGEPVGRSALAAR